MSRFARLQQEFRRHAQQQTQPAQALPPVIVLGPVAPPVPQVWIDPAFNRPKPLRARQKGESVWS